MKNNRENNQSISLNEDSLLGKKIFKDSEEGFTCRVVHNIGEAISLIEVGFEYVTGEYSDGGKLFRKRK